MSEGSRNALSWAGLVRGNVAERAALPLVWGLTVLVFSILKPDTFPTRSNFLVNIFGTQAVQVVVALALIFPLVTGDSTSRSRRTSRSAR